MRRVIALGIVLCFLVQSGGSALAAAPGAVNAPSLWAVTLQPLLASIRDSQIVAVLTGQGARFAAAHAVAPKFSFDHSAVLPKADNRPQHAHPAFHTGTAMLPHLPAGIPHAIPDPLAMFHGASSAQRRLSAVRTSRHPLATATLPPTSGQPALTASGTGVQPWNTYEADSLPGVGQFFVNVANGNLIASIDDTDIKTRGIDLAFRRVFNSFSHHDALNTDGTIPSAYGNGWTSNFDMHVQYNATSGVMSVYDIDGSRYDFTPDGNGGWVAPPGIHNTLTFDGCIYSYVKKSGTMYRMYAPYATSCITSAQSAFFGRTANIYARNLNNHKNRPGRGNLATIT